MPTPAACSKQRRNCSRDRLQFRLQKSPRLAKGARTWGTRFLVHVGTAAIGCPASVASACHTQSVSHEMSREPDFARDGAELIFGFGLLMLVLWTPGFPQIVLAPVALLATLAIVLARRPTLDEVGLGRRGLAASLWILPAAIAFAVTSIFVAKRLGTLHALYKGDFQHIAGYFLWTLYQQFLLNDYFMPRLQRILPRDSAARSLAALLFAAAHLPNLPLTAATLLWGAISCALFRRYRNLYALGLAQGLLGLCFAICVPDALHHHLKVGLGYWREMPPPSR
jgi:membrane protease YdiL (CAAX protease family)